jgi:hypothetical protein
VVNSIKVHGKAFLCTRRGIKEKEGILIGCGVHEKHGNLGHRHGGKQIIWIPYEDISICHFFPGSPLFPTKLLKVSIAQ